ncbi:MAG: hypothetical protein V3R63_03785 [Alphaproteobacteria bacterium]
MTKEILTIISGLGAAAALLASGFWFRASILEVPDNIDTFIGALQRISRINACGGLSATVAAICGATLFVFGGV